MSSLLPPSRRRGSPVARPLAERDRRGGASLLGPIYAAPVMALGSCAGWRSTSCMRRPPGAAASDFARQNRSCASGSVFIGSASSFRRISPGWASRERLSRSVALIASLTTASGLRRLRRLLRRKWRYTLAPLTAGRRDSRGFLRPSDDRRRHPAPNGQDRAQHAFHRDGVTAPRRSPWWPYPVLFQVLGSTTLQQGFLNRATSTTSRSLVRVGSRSFRRGGPSFDQS